VITLRAGSYLSFRDTEQVGRAGNSSPTNATVAFTHRRRLAEWRGGWPLVALGRAPAALTTDQEVWAGPLNPNLRLSLMRNAARSHNAGGANPACGNHQATCRDRLCTSASRATSAARGVGSATLPTRSRKERKSRRRSRVHEDVLSIRTTETESLQDAIEQTLVKRRPVLTVYAEETAHDFSAGTLSNSLSKGA
jgi:hypothetical protein